MKNRKYTQKRALEILSKTRITVVSFDKESGIRNLMYGDLDLITAIQHISQRQKKYDLLICDYDMVSKWESNFKKRINYSNAQRMAVTLNII